MARPIHASPIFTALLAMIQPSSVRAQASVTNTPSTTYTSAALSGETYAIAKSGNTVYVSGNFDYIGPPTGSAALLDATTGAANMGFPVTNTSVNAGVQVSGAASDGAGGWFVCGTFTLIGEKSRAGLAHVKSDLTVDDDWVPTVNQSVCIAVGNGRVYVAGTTSVAALDPVTGATLFNVGVNSVRAMVLSGSTLFVGGGFGTVGGQARSNLAALDATTGSVLAWTANTDGLVTSLAVDGSTLYVGGGFSAIGGFARGRLAGVDVSTGAVSLWNPNLNGQVNSVAVAGGIVYAGGIFNTIGGTPRKSLAAISASTGMATAWDPAPDDGPNTVAVYAVAPVGGLVYVGGTFSSVGGQPRLRVAALDAGTGLATSWRPEASGDVTEIVVWGSNVVIGGAFHSAGGKARRGLAAYDAVSGAIASWDPSPDGDVRSIAPTASAIYVGGLFTSIGGQNRSRLAALSPATGLATSWDPGADGDVYRVVPTGSLVYVGGGFSNCGGAARTNIAAIDALTGTATSWNPAANGSVYRILLNGGLVYVGGGFTNIGGQSRVGLAALSPATGLANAWNPGASNVYGMSTDGSILYVYGNFTSAGVGAPLRRYAAGIDMTTGFATSFNPSPSGNPSPGDIVYAHSKVYIAASSLGGAPITIGGQPNRYFAELDPATGNATAFTGDCISAVFRWGISAGLYSDGTVLYMGAYNTFFRPPMGAWRRNLAAYDLTIQVGVGDQDLAHALSVEVGPNPSIGPAHFRLALPHDERVRVSVFDIQGREVARLADEWMAAGSRQLSWSGATRSGRRQSGVYFVRAEAAGSVSTRRFVVLH